MASFLNRIHDRIAQEPTKIGLLQHFGTGNLGDDAAVDAIMQHIKDRWPCAVFVGLSLYPADSERRHGIPCYPIRRGDFSPKHGQAAVKTSLGKKSIGRGFKDKLKAALDRCHLLSLVRPPKRLFEELLFLVKSFRLAKSLDILVVCGGGQLLDDWGGPWAFPYTLFKWALLAKLAGTKCYFVNLGAGPLNHPLSKWFVRRTLYSADYVTFRDDKSSALIHEIGFNGKAEVIADSVYGLKVPNVGTHDRRVRNGNDLVIAISPMAYRDPRRYWDQDQAGYDRYINELADFCARLIGDRHRLRLFGSDVWFDSQANIDLEAAIKERLAIDTSHWLTRESVKSIDELLSQLSEVDCLVTCKFHGVIFGQLLNVPILAIAHHSKVAKLMDDFRLAEYCVDIQTFNADVLTKMFERLVANIRNIKASVPEKVELYRRNLQTQFDNLFPSTDEPYCVREGRMTGSAR